MFKSSTINLIKPIATYFNFDDLLRSSYVHLMQTGEFIKFSLLGRPKPSDAILLVGSGRSGTTWLTEILTRDTGVQQIFEPLIPFWNETIRNITGWDKSISYLRSWYLNREEDSPEWNILLTRVLTGKVRNYWTDYIRTSYFPDAFLIKEIRANLMLGYIYKNFTPNYIIFIMRHPCAVINSRMSVGWHADVRDILVQERLVEDYLHPWIKDIEQEKDVLGAHAVWWAVENYIAMKELEEIPHYEITFEELCLNPIAKSRELFSYLNLSPPLNFTDVVDIPSRMSRSNAEYSSIKSRLSSWKSELSVEDQERILSWGKKLGLDCYDDNELPREIRGKYE